MAKKKVAKKKVAKKKVAKKKVAKKKVAKKSAKKTAKIAVKKATNTAKKAVKKVAKKAKSTIKKGVSKMAKKSEKKTAKRVSRRPKGKFDLKGALIPIATGTAGVLAMNYVASKAELTPNKRDAIEVGLGIILASGIITKNPMVRGIGVGLGINGATRLAVAQVPELAGEDYTPEEIAELENIALQQLEGYDPEGELYPTSTEVMLGNTEVELGNTEVELGNFQDYGFEMY